MFTQNEILEIIKSYTENYDSLTELGKKYNCTAYSIKNILLSNNIQIRTRQEQTKYTNIKRAKYKNNHNYFSSIDSCNKAWLLGFLASDGSVNKRENAIKISLSAVDGEILEKIKKEIQTESPVKYRETNNGFHVVSLEWTSAQQKSDLAKYGIIPNKTYKENHLPSFDNDDYTLAYILGYFDGDGSISVSREGYLRFRLCSYIRTLLEEIAEFLNKKYKATYSINAASTRQMHELSISTEYAKKIFNDMYNLNCLHLNRKYQKYLEYKSHETPTSIIR